MLTRGLRGRQVRGLKGFGEKTRRRFWPASTIAATADERMYWAEADEIVQELLAHMRTCSKASGRWKSAGSYRRGRETIGDLDLLVDANDADAVMDHFGRFAGSGDGHRPRRHEDVDPARRGLQIDLRVVPAESFGAALQYFTGSKDHNVILRGMAKDRGLKINEYGVFRVDKARLRARHWIAERVHRRPHRRGSLRRARLAVLSAGDPRSAAGVRLGRRRQVAAS